MSLLSEGSDYVERLARQYEPLLAVAKIMRDSGSLEGHVCELTASRDKLFIEIEKVKADLSEWKVRANAELSSHESKVIEAQEHAARLEKAAEVHIKEQLEKAEGDAKSSVQAIYDASIAQKDAYHKEVEDAKAAVLDAQQAVAKAKDEQVQAEADAVHAKAALGEIMKTIERLSKFGSADKDA